MPPIQNAQAREEASAVSRAWRRNASIGFPMSIAVKTTMAWFSTGRRCGADLTSVSRISPLDATDLAAGVPGGEKAIMIDLVNDGMTIIAATSVAIATRGMTDTTTDDGVELLCLSCIICAVPELFTSILFFECIWRQASSVWEVYFEYFALALGERGYSQQSSRIH